MDGSDLRRTEWVRGDEPDVPRIGMQRKVRKMNAGLLYFFIKKIIWTVHPVDCIADEGEPLIQIACVI